ncbi:MAG TPA: nucleotidyltransferase [Opitutaceae bacterium]|nr:nucleotidyltransferase [Opitutaceae bacterium]
MKSLRLLLQRLADAGLEFVVIGGFAGVLHGSSYVTRDLDICAVMSPENFAKLRQALSDLNPVHRMTPKKLSFLHHPGDDSRLLNVHLETDAGAVDVLGDVLGIGAYEELVQNSIEIPLFGRTCRVISLEALIKAKEAVGREKDLLVAKELQAIAAKRKAAAESG